MGSLLSLLTFQKEGQKNRLVLELECFKKNLGNYSFNYNYSMYATAVA